MDNKYMSSEDIKLIDNLLEYANNLVIKDNDTAELNELKNSKTLSNELIYSKYAVINNEATEHDYEVIKNYTELNKYYIKLKEKYDIDYFDARVTPDRYILKENKMTISNIHARIFKECYYEALNYYNRVLSTEAFKNQKLNRNYIQFFIVYSSIQKFITKTMEQYFDIDNYSLRDLKNSFISNGLDYFDNLPIDYQRRLLKSLNYLLSYKGTNEAIKQALNIFGFDNILIYKYVLCKDYKVKDYSKNIRFEEPFAFFLKTEVDKIPNAETDMVIDFNKMTQSDPYWYPSESEVVNEDFNTINTKYLSVDASIDAMKESINLSYFMSLLKRLKTEKGLNDKTFKFVNSNISESPIDLFDGIVALQAIIVRMNGYVDLITKSPDVVNYIYGYNDLENNIDLKNFYDKIEKIFYEQSNTINNYNKIRFLIDKFKLKGFNDKEQISLQEFIDIFNENEEMRKFLEDFIIETDNYDLYRILNQIWDIKMKTQNNIKVYEGFETYTSYLKNLNFDLYKYVERPKLEIMTEDSKREYYKNCIFEITESISNFLVDTNLRKYFLNSPYIGIIDHIEKYIYTIISLFKSYTIDLVSANMVLRFASKLENTIKVFDKALVSEELYFAERVDTEMVENNFIETFRNIENINVNDQLNIKYYISGEEVSKDEFEQFE